MQELLISARFKMYLLSVVFYNLDGEPIGYVAIDNSYGPLPQGGQGGTRPFERLMSYYSSMEWEYIPAYSDVFMEMDHSPQAGVVEEAGGLQHSAHDRRRRGIRRRAQAAGR